MGVADRVVVGGGIVGWSAALELIEREPGRRVVLVDDARSGRATPAGAGIATPFTRRDMGPDWSELLFGAMHAYDRLLPRLRDAGLDPGHQVVGRLLVALDEQEAEFLPGVLERLRGRVAEHGSLGIGEPEIVDGATAATLHPLLAPTHGALLMPQVAQVDGRALQAALAARAQALGVVARTGRAELISDGAHLLGVRVDGERIGCERIVLATGAWTDALLEPLGLRSGVYPQRGQIVHARTDAAAPLPIVTSFTETYLLCFADGRLVMGPTREDSSGFEQTPTIGGLREMLERSHRLAPGVATAHWSEIRSGLRPMSHDGVPTMGEIAHLPGLVLAIGLGAQGLTAGPHVGAWAAQIADGEAPPVPAAFSPQRWVGEAGRAVSASPAPPGA